MLLATQKDLETLLSAEPDDPRLALALRRASAAFVGQAGWPITRTINDTLILDGHGGRTLVLPAMNVTEATVKVDGQPAGDVTLNPRLGVLHRAAGWPCGNGNIEVTYSHGWDEIPGDISDAVLERAAHIAESLGIATQESTAGMSITYNAAALGGATQNWTDTVARYSVTQDRA